MAPLLPKLRGQLAEFLNESYPVHLSLLSQPTCVGFQYGRPDSSLEAFLGSWASEGQWWAGICHTVLPNWQIFWMADALDRAKTIPWSYVGRAFGYVVGYLGAALALALLFFEDRELS